MRYELYYWPNIQGRAEFIRLALEQAGAEYLDVARLPEQDGMGVPALRKMMDDASLVTPIFAPPFIKADDLVISQTANILQYLAPRLNLVPDDETLRLWANQLQLTICDLATEAHETHHPIAVSLVYEDQEHEAQRRATHFIAERIPKFLDYFEKVLIRNPAGDRFMVGDTLSYVDLSMFQIITGLRYAFPRAMQSLAPQCQRVTALVAHVAARPRIAAYLASNRRLPFSEKDLFRHYSHLDANLHLR